MKFEYHTTIPLYNRETKKYEEEIVYNTKLKKFLYDTKFGKIVNHIIAARKRVSWFYGLLQKKEKSKKEIVPYINKYNLNVDEFEKAVHEFKDFNDFFKRKLKSSARPICPKKDSFISPADGRLYTAKIDEDLLVPVKGIKFPIKELLKSDQIVDEYKNGLCLIFRLVPYDYHRFCYIDEGTHSEVKKLKGLYHVSSPTSFILRKFPVYHGNYREYCILNTRNFDEVVHMEIGAMTVGKVKQNHFSGTSFKKGDEKGYFEYGASTIILLVKPGIIDLDNDIKEASLQGIESMVRYGSTIGKKIEK